jgi:inner membrane protein
MLLFAHTGITLGIGWLIKERANTSQPGVLSEIYHATGKDTNSTAAVGKGNSVVTGHLSRVAMALDLRLLIVGSLLPDIIDKPLGQIFLRHSLNNGRIYSHTLLFLVVLIIMAAALYHQRRKAWIYLLAGGTFTHLIMDEMWLEPQTLFWPFFDLGFPRETGTISGWITQMFQGLFRSPAVFVPEVIGFIIIILFALVLIRRRKVVPFLRSGLIKD